MGIKAEDVDPFTGYRFEQLFDKGARKNVLIEFPEEVLRDPRRLKIWRDRYAVIEYAYQQARRQATLEIAKKLKDNCLDIALIMEVTKLTQAEIDEL